ncbi:MAG: hypothetical protein K0S99_1811 [Thermomicrobiales bacterium]|jgi:hypothetical protein|nr:hypothetical protein [Thermomicrobiales bacterium]
MIAPRPPRSSRIAETTAFARAMLQSLNTTLKSMPSYRLIEAAEALGLDSPYEDAVVARFMLDLATWKRMIEGTEACDDRTTTDAHL